MSKRVVFYSWQSDLPDNVNRAFIELCLGHAVDDIRSDDNVAVDPVVDRDTTGVSGAPDIAATILDKIDRASVFVADVSIVQRPTDGRPCPNPNVLVEFGYALRAHGWSRIILVMNTAYGSPEQLPFDLRHKRILSYALDKPGDRDAQQAHLCRELAKNLKMALSSLSSEENITVSLELRYEVVDRSARVHHYRLHPTVHNSGKEPLVEFHVDVELPRAFLNESRYSNEVKNRSTLTHLFLRFQNSARTPVFPGDSNPVGRISYFVDDQVYDSGKLDQKIKAILYVKGIEPIVIERNMRELQDF